MFASPGVGVSNHFLELNHGIIDIFEMAASFPQELQALKLNMIYIRRDTLGLFC